MKLYISIICSTILIRNIYYTSTINSLTQYISPHLSDTLSQPTSLTHWVNPYY